MAYLKPGRERVNFKGHVRRRTSVSTPAQSPRIENDQSCTSAQCREQADRPGSGPLTSSKSTKALEEKSGTNFRSMSQQLEYDQNVPLEIVSAGDH